MDLDHLPPRAPTDELWPRARSIRCPKGSKDVGIWGRANVIRQYLKAGLLDEMQVHLVPVLLGGGVRLFEDLGTDRIDLRRTRSIETAGATHLRFDVVR
jgi:dihydrofolate reductase